MGFDMCDMFSSRVDFVCPKAGFKPGGLREGNLEHICTVLQHFKWVYYGTKKSAAVPPVKPLENLQDGISGEAEDRGHDADVFPLNPCGFTMVLEMAP